MRGSGVDHSGELSQMGEESKVKRRKHLTLKTEGQKHSPEARGVKLRGGRI